MTNFLSLNSINKHYSIRKLLSSLILVSFITSSVATPAGAQVLPVAGPAGMTAGLASWLGTSSDISSSVGFQPPVLIGLKIHPENPLLFDFIVDQGTTKLSEDELKLETEKLVKYFLTAVTIPDKEAWVNLSPYEKDRIIPDALGQTMMGKTMLEQDYQLKQLAASLTHPDTELGKTYWDGVRKTLDVGSWSLEQKTSNQQLATSDFSKVWIVPQDAEVLENNGIAVVGKKTLKVMMQEEYERNSTPPSPLFKKEGGRTDTTETPSLDKEGVGGVLTNNISSHVFRTTILPVIEKEINEGQNFAEVRQIYNSVILAAWYKQALKDSLLGKIYMDKGKVVGVESGDKDIKQKIYDQYIAAFKKGAYNVIREEPDGTTGDLIPRKYFSGGWRVTPENLSIVSSSVAAQQKVLGASSSTVFITAQGVESTQGQVEKAIVAGQSAAKGDRTSSAVFTLTPKVGIKLQELKEQAPAYLRELLTEDLVQEILNNLSETHEAQKYARIRLEVSDPIPPFGFAPPQSVLSLEEKQAYREVAEMLGLREKGEKMMKFYFPLINGQEGSYDDFRSRNQAEGYVLKSLGGFDEAYDRMDTASFGETKSLKFHKDALIVIRQMAILDDGRRDFFREIPLSALLTFVQVIGAERNKINKSNEYSLELLDYVLISISSYERGALSLKHPPVYASKNSIEYRNSPTPGSWVFRSLRANVLRAKENIGAVKDMSKKIMKYKDDERKLVIALEGANDVKPGEFISREAAEFIIQYVIDHPSDNVQIPNSVIITIIEANRRDRARYEGSRSGILLEVQKRLAEIQDKIDAENKQAQVVQQRLNNEVNWKRQAGLTSRNVLTGKGENILQKLIGQVGIDPNVAEYLTMSQTNFLLTMVRNAALKSAESVNDEVRLNLATGLSSDNEYKNDIMEARRIIAKEVFRMAPRDQKNGRDVYVYKMPGTVNAIYGEFITEMQNSYRVVQFDAGVEVALIAAVNGTLSLAQAELLVRNAGVSPENSEVPLKAVLVVADAALASPKQYSVSTLQVVEEKLQGHLEELKKKRSPAAKVQEQEVNARLAVLSDIIKAQMGLDYVPPSQEGRKVLIAREWAEVAGEEEISVAAAKRIAIISKVINKPISLNVALTLSQGAIDGLMDQSDLEVLQSASDRLKEEKSKDIKEQKAELDKVIESLSASSTAVITQQEIEINIRDYFVGSRQNYWISLSRNKSNVQDILKQQTFWNTIRTFKDTYYNDWAEGFNSGDVPGVVRRFFEQTVNEQLLLVGIKVNPNLLPDQNAIRPGDASAGQSASAPTESFNKGGIDFDPTNMNLQIKRDGRGVPLPLLQQNWEQINIDGIVPVIINIVPITAANLPIFLGQAPKEPGREPSDEGRPELVVRVAS